MCMKDPFLQIQSHTECIHNTKLLSSGSMSISSRNFNTCICILKHTCTYSTYIHTIQCHTLILSLWVGDSIVLILNGISTATWTLTSLEGTQHVLQCNINLEKCPWINCVIWSTSHHKHGFHFLAHKNTHDNTRNVKYSPLFGDFDFIHIRLQGI